jgi:membrane protein DedA with SNARE-associated domain
MEWIEQAVAWLQQLPPLSVFALMFFVAYIENIFPPSPSDVLLIFIGTLIGVGTIGFMPALLCATLGSTLGFITAYLIGRYFQRGVIEGRLSRFLPVNTIAQVEALFLRYGYGVIVANRFLAGTRAIVSFFAGMAKLSLPITTALCAVSALAWNAILLYLGKFFANNWRSAVEYLELYSKGATALVVILIAIFLWRFFKHRKLTTGH